MRFRRGASAMLALSLMLSGTSIVAYADTAAEEAMKKEFTYVKQRVTIPEDLSEFNYTKNTNYGRDTYNFSWTTDPEEYTTGHKEISVQICGKVITSYSRYEYDWTADSESGYSFAKLSEDELYNKAYKWIKILNPSVYKSIEIDKDSLSISLSGERARFIINRVVEGVPVKGQQGSIVINKDTGELISYGLSWVMGAGFPDPDTTISKEEAIAAYEEKMPVEKVYFANYNWQTKEYEPKLIYRQTLSQQIDALTGELTTFEGSYFNYYGDDDVTVDEEADLEANPGAGGVSFTDKELEKMEKEGSLVTAEEMLQTLKDMKMFSLGDNPAIEYSSCYYDDYLGYYVRNMSFASEDTVYYIGKDTDGNPVQKEKDVVINTYATINAENGDLLSFSGGSNYTGDERPLNEKNASKTLNSYLDILAGGKADEFRLSDATITWSARNKDGTPAEGAYVTSASASSPRYAYGIPSMSESVNIKINSDLLITSYNIDYYGVEYPEPVDILTEEEVYDSYFDQIDYDLQYRLAIQKDVTYTAVVYNPSHTLYIDAFSGKLTYSDGTEMKQYSVDSYTDLEGSKYKKIAEKLEAYGIVLRDEDGRLNEDEYITREDFSTLMSNIGSWYNNRTNGDKVLTRQFAAKILTNRIISEECAELAGIFRSPFSDVKENSKYVGYIAVANALGYMKGENGKFNPGAKVTRGEALQMIYDRLA